MPRFKIDSHDEPGQTGRLKDDDRIRPIAEDALFQLGQSLWRGLEAEAVASCASLVQATYLVLSGAGRSIPTLLIIHFSFTSIRAPW